MSIERSFQVSRVDGTAADGAAPDAVVVGSGPNGLAAAITLARAGRRVRVLEGEPTIGGGLRTSELTLPGFLHDECSAVHPFGRLSPFLASAALEELGVEWIDPPILLAHPFDDGPPALLYQSLAATADSLGSVDGLVYARLMRPFVERAQELTNDAVAPLHIPRHPLLMARFGWYALLSAQSLVTSQFSGDRARALFAGIAAHATIPLTSIASASFGLVLAMAGHAVGWPIPRGGSQRLADALAQRLQKLGGTVETGRHVESLRDIDRYRLALLDVTPRQLLRIAGDALPGGYRRALARYRYGPGTFKVDWALSAPVPWKAPECHLAGTLHLAGSPDEISAAEEAPWRGTVAERPFVLIVQQSLFDPTRAPEGRHTLWGYCHVPNGSNVDMTSRIEAQIERFAPGFRDVILARRVSFPRDLEARNENLVGGDIGAGANTLDQIFFRPTRSLSPYATPIDGLYLCSASTPPGGGVHGLCGHYAATLALERSKKR